MSSLVVAGLGPAGLDRLPARILTLLTDLSQRVIVRTRHHPAAAELAQQRPVESCDDLYQGAGDLEGVYRSIVGRVVEAVAAGPVVYAVPGSPLVGERTVELLRSAVSDLVIEPAESFLDLVLARVGIDPLATGLQLLDGRALPEPLTLGLPTVVAQVDRPLVAAEVKLALLSVLDADAPVTVLSDLGGADETVERVALASLDRVAVGPRTTLYLEPAAVGWPGLVATVARLRAECPWDRRQTHHSLVRHLIEESYELVEALGGLSADAPAGPVDHVAYTLIEEELGDVLLQVLFHARMAEEAGAFGIEEVAEAMRRKLVHRHPHVFGDTRAATAAEVEANWERLKHEEKGRASLMDDVPASLPALARAAKVQRRAASVGFDWKAPEPVLDKVVGEAGELRSVLEQPAAAAAELGDLLFSVVNLSRHLHVDPEMALRQAVDRFAERFRLMEAEGDLEGLGVAELERRWERAKAEQMSSGDRSP